MTFAFALAACQVSQPTTARTPRGSAAQAAGQRAGSVSRSSRRFANDFGDIYEGVECDALTEGLAWCDDDVTIAYCSVDTWWLLDCTDAGYGYCGDDGYTVDCY
jgi:hypothetical protein